MTSSPPSTAHLHLPPTPPNLTVKLMSADCCVSVLEIVLCWLLIVVNCTTPLCVLSHSFCLFLAFRAAMNRLNMSNQIPNKIVDQTSIKVAHFKILVCSFPVWVLNINIHQVTQQLGIGLISFQSCGKQTFQFSYLFFSPHSSDIIF